MIDAVHGVGAWSLDLATGEMEVSANLRRLAGWNAHAPFLLDTFVGGVHPDDRAVVEELLALDAPGVRQARFRVRRRDGAERWLHVSAETLRDAQGRPEAQLGAASDVTDLQGAQWRLTQHRDVTDHLAERYGGMGWRIGAGGGLFWSESWRRFTGRTLSELRTRGWTVAVHPDERDAAAAELDLCVRAGQTFDRVVRFQRADGRYVPMRVCAVPVRLPDGRILEWGAVALPAATAAAPERDPPASPEPRPTPAELRGARGLLGWSVERLVRESGVSAATVARYEAGRGDGGAIRASTLAKLRTALEDGGVVFHGGDGALHGIGLRG